MDNYQLDQDLSDLTSLFHNNNRATNDIKKEVMDGNTILSNLLMTPPISPSAKRDIASSGEQEEKLRIPSSNVKTMVKKKKTYNTNKNKVKSYSTPNNISNALLKDQNKLIHLDPVPNFKDKSEIKPWLQKIFFPQGIDIVIERSDSGKVIFKCKSPAKRRNNASIHQEQESTKPSSSNSATCPFRIRATFSIKLKKWNIVVVNNSHSHDLKFNPNSDEYKKFKDYLKNSDDFDTIKKFEELEYRSKLNLPINPSIIPCDCGLTSEIQSFNIILPTSKVCGAIKVQKEKKNARSMVSSQTANKNNKLKKFNEQNILKKSTQPLSTSNTSPSLGSDFIDNTNILTTGNGDDFVLPILTPDYACLLYTSRCV